MSTELLEQEVQTETKQKKRRGTWLLILLLIILILFLLSTIVLGSRLYDMATRDQYTVDLGMGEPEGVIELFRIEYSNAQGEITVQGANADNVVAPGTTVSYDIRLRNNDEVVIDFLMTPTVDFLTGDEVPVEFKIIDDYGNYILGSETEWVRSDDMNALAHKGQIHPGEVFTYHVSWRWIFEVSDEQDAYDTYLGNQDGEVLPGVRVGIETQASANPTPVKDNRHMMHLLGEGFGCCWCCYIVWLLLLVCLLLLIWVWRLRKKLSKHEETMEEYEKVLTIHGLMVDGELVEQIHAK